MNFHFLHKYFMNEIKIFIADAGTGITIFKNIYIYIL
jgi:hypothetical protein